MATITNLGIGGDANLQNLLDQLSKAEQSKLDPYTNKQKQDNAQISEWGKISNLLNGLRNVSDKLSDAAFNKLKISNNDAFSVKQTGDADSGTHQIIVKRLASSDSLVTKGFKDETTQLGSNTGKDRTITITEKNGKKMTVSLTSDQTSLKGIAKAINDKGGDVTATVVKSDAGYQLKLTSKTTGSDGNMTVKVDGDNTLGKVLDYDPNHPQSSSMSELTKGQDAKFSVDGIDYTRSSNTINDVLDGLTLTLKKPSKDQKNGEELTMSPDYSQVKKQVQNFVKKYNALVKELSAAGKWVSPNNTDSNNNNNNGLLQKNSGQSGPLVGDNTLRNLTSTLHSDMNQVYGNSDISALSDLGISIDSKTGKMSLDKSKLDDAISDHPEEIKQMFVGTDKAPGLAKNLSKDITDYIGPDKVTKDDKGANGGIIKDTTDALNDQLKEVKQEIDSTQKLVDAQIDIYRTQFENLDVMMNKMTGISNQLTSMFKSS